jgi:hypothetical protein
MRIKPFVKSLRDGLREAAEEAQGPLRIEELRRRARRRACPEAFSRTSGAVL